jgi:hypothetical protein
MNSMLSQPQPYIVALYRDVRDKNFVCYVMLRRYEMFYVKSIISPSVSSRNNIGHCAESLVLFQNGRGNYTSLSRAILEYSCRLICGL